MSLNLVNRAHTKKGEKMRKFVLQKIEQNENESKLSQV